MSVTQYVTTQASCQGIRPEQFGIVNYIFGVSLDGCKVYQDIAEVMCDKVDWSGEGDDAIIVTPSGLQNHDVTFEIVVSPETDNTLEKRPDGLYVPPSPAPEPQLIETTDPIIGDGSLLNPIGIDLCKMGEQIPLIDEGMPLIMLSLDTGTRCPVGNLIGLSEPCEVPLSMVGLDGALKPKIYFLDNFRSLPPVVVTDTLTTAVYNVVQPGIFDMNQSITIQLCNTHECRPLHYEVIADSGRTRFEADGGYQRWRKWARLTGPGMADGVVAGFTWDSAREAYFAYPTDNRRHTGVLLPGECADWTMRIEAEILDFESVGQNYQVDSGRVRLTAIGRYT